MSFIFLGKMPRNVIVGLYGKCMFSFIRNCQITFHNVCNLLHPDQKSLKGTVICILASIWFCQFLNVSCNTYVVIYHCDFNLPFLIANFIKNLLKCYLLPIYLFCEMPFVNFLTRFFFYF